MASDFLVAVKNGIVSGIPELVQSPNHENVETFMILARIRGAWGAPTSRQAAVHKTELDSGRKAQCVTRPVTKVWWSCRCGCCTSNTPKGDFMTSLQGHYMEGQDSPYLEDC